MIYFKKIFYLIKDFKKEIYILIFLIGLGSVLELVSLSSLIPVISFFLGNEISYLENFFYLEKKNIIYFLIFTILIFFILKTFFFIYLDVYKNKLLAKIGSNLSKRLFSFYLKKDYPFHLRNSSSKLINNIDETINIVNGLLSSFINIFIDSCIAILIVIFLLNINLIITTILLLSVIFVSLFYYLIIKNYLKDLGENKFLLRQIKIKFLQESLFGIREIKLFNNYNYAIDGFQKANLGLLKIISKDSTIKSLPKLIFEFLIIFLFIGLILFLLYLQKDNSYIAFLLGVFLISSIRFIPIMSRLLNSFQNLRIGIKGLDEIYREFKLCEREEKLKEKSVIFEKQKIFFHKEIKFENVNFKYRHNSELILQDISISIFKGDTIAITGDSGSGKSTFLDLFCGLLRPSKGEILIDDKNLFLKENLWQSKISYVSQNIFLNEGTILENITFGQTKDPIDKILLNKVLAMTGLNDFIYNLPSGAETYIGERGVKLSGGQKQRIGIARALYRNTDILILDEATNALDINNEQKIIFSVKEHCIGKTLIFVSHRKETLQYCDTIFNLENKKIIKLSNILD